MIMKTKSLLLSEGTPNVSLDFVCDETTKAIALTPIAMAQFDKLGIEYKIPEDYYIWQEPDDYEEWFVERWLSMLSQVLKDHYSHEAGAEVPSLHCISMLRNVVDVFIRTALQFDVIMQKERPGAITYMTPYRTEDYYDDELFFKGWSLFYRMFESSCDVNGYLTNVIMENKSSPEPKKTYDWDWRDKPFVRNPYEWTRSMMWLPSWKKGLPILFAGPSPAGIRAVKKMGYKAGLVIDFPEKLIGVDKRSLKPDGLKDLFVEVSEKFGIDLSIVESVLASRILYFIESIAPRIFAVKKYFMKKLWGKYRAVFFNRRNKLYQYALLLAAEELNIPTVYIRHGWEAYYTWISKYRWFDRYDYFLCSVEDDIEFYQAEALKFGSKCSVL